MPGGYCTAPCGETGAACGAACVETWRGGELCMATCASDADCRSGYACDPQWRACTLPAITAMKVKACPAADARDPAFGAVDQLSTAAMPGIYQFEPAAALADDGGVVAMYISRASLREPNVLGVSRVAPDGKLTIDTPFSSGRNTNFDPWLASGKGEIYAVWLGFDGASERAQIGFASSTDRGATWSAPTAVQDTPCADEEGDCLDKPMAIVGRDPGGKGEIVYVTYATAEALRVRASRDGGKTWSASVSPLAGIYGNSAVSPDGRLHLVTVNGGPQGSYGSTDQKIEYAVSADGAATFAPAITVSAPSESIPFFFSNPSVAVDDRWIYVAYARGAKDGAWDIALAASKDRGKTWTRARIGDDCATHLVPNLALDARTGTLHVTWYDSHGTGRYAHATCTAGLASCTELGAIDSAPFAALSTERHGSKWIGDYASLLVDDKRRVLHALWSQPVTEGGKVVTRVFHAKAKL